MKKCVIMRGIPGSGKSTRSRELAGEAGVIHSTDEYFMKDGEHCWDPTRLGRNHMLNYQAFMKSVLAGVTPVIVDNTNIRRRDFYQYETFATMHGYEVELVEVPMIDAKIAAARNSHGVPQKAIERMIARWEK